MARENLVTLMAEQKKIHKQKVGFSEEKSQIGVFMLTYGPLPFLLFPRRCWSADFWSSGIEDGAWRSCSRGG